MDSKTPDKMRLAGISSDRQRIFQPQVPAVGCWFIRGLLRRPAQVVVLPAPPKRGGLQRPSQLRRATTLGRSQSLGAQASAWPSLLFQTGCGMGRKGSKLQ